MMSSDRKIRSLGFIAGFLLITNIIMLIFFIGINDGKKTMHVRENLIGNFLKKDIGFNDNQMNDYQHLRTIDMDSMKPYFSNLRASKDSFYHFVTVPASSDSQMKGLSSLIGENQMKVDEQMLHHFQKVRALCTAEQLPKFDSLFKNVISRVTTGRIKKNYKEQQ